MNNGQFVDRRSGQDRRSLSDLESGSERRSGFDRRRSNTLDGSAFGFAAPGDYRPESPLATREGSALTGIPSLPFPASNREFLAGLGSVLTELVSGFYDASMDPKLWPELLGKMRDAVHADSAAVMSHDFEQGRGQLDHTVSIDAMFVTAYRDFYSRQNVYLQEAENFGQPGVVFTNTQLAESAKVLDTDFYRYWLRPQNLFHHLIGILDAQGSQVTLLTFARAREKGAFWEDDIELLFRLLPHLRQGLRAGHIFRRVQDVERILLDTLDVMPMGIALLGCSGTVIAANRAARDIIDTDDALYLGSSGLGLKLPAGRFRFRDFLAGTLGEPRNEASGELHTFSVPREDGRRPITLLVMPVKDRTQRRADRDPVAVLFIGDPERPVDIDPRQLVRLYTLSRAEARVAVLLARGLRLEQCAQHLGLTYETVRKHLKQIFSKTGTDRQAELIRTLTSGPAGLRL